MAIILPSYSPAVLVDIYFSTTYRASTKDLFIGLNNDFYRATLLGFPIITEELSDIFYGVEQPSPVTLRFANIDNGIDDTWDDIRDAQEIRGTAVRIRRHELINTGVWATEAGVALVTEDSGPYGGEQFLINQYEIMEYRGKIVDYKIGHEVEITVEMRQDDILETLLPLKVVTTDEFTETALDLGEPINIPFGKCRDVPLRNIQNNTTDDYYDYLIGYGVIQGLRIDHVNGLGVKREGVLVNESTYTLYDGSQDDPFPGYAFLRFTKKQMNFSGGYYSLTADVNGLEMGGTTAQRNFARVIENLLSDITWGLSDIVDSGYFREAADDLDAITNMYCDGAITTQRPARDILDDLLFCARAGIGRTELGEWWIKIDTLDTSIMNFGDNDGYYDNANIKDVGTTPSNNALKTAFIHYDVSISNDRALKEISLPIHATFGIDRIYTLPFVAEDDTAKKVLSYIYGRSIYAEKMATVIAGMEARDLRRGKIVSLTKTARNLSAEDFKIDRITRKAIGFDLECRSYSSNIYGDQTIEPPTVPSFSGVVSTDPRNLPDLATTDPGIEGVLWNDSGTVKISAGP